MNLNRVDAATEPWIGDLATVLSVSTTSGYGRLIVLASLLTTARPSEVELVK